MTTLADRPNTALLVVDVQTDVVRGNVDVEGVVERIGSLVEKAREAGTPTPTRPRTSPTTGPRRPTRS